MKVLVQRSQRAALLGGKPVFTLVIRADLDKEEREAISKYEMSGTQLFSSLEMIDKGSGLMGLASRLAFKAVNTTVYVKDLLNGKTIECRDILEMLAIEEQIRIAAQNFKAMLDAARTFGGEEVMAL